MQQIFINDSQIDEGRITVEGDDAKHLIKVCRIQSGENIRVSTSDENNYICVVEDVEDSRLTLSIEKEVPTTELPCEIRLYQAIPKGDRMETVIEKCVELGVSEIIPVEMKHCVVRLDDKKKAKKVSRYQSIAVSAAKQSKRSVIPRIGDVISFADAAKKFKKSDVCIVPYENKNGMAETSKALSKIKKGDTVSVMIGPEGGFAPEEIEALNDCNIISLGSRILRTDTAAITTVAMIMLSVEMELHNI